MHAHVGMMLALSGEFTGGEITRGPSRSRNMIHRGNGVGDGGKLARIVEDFPKSLDANKLWGFEYPMQYVVKFWAALMVTPALKAF